MAWSGSGTFSRIMNWAADKAANINITASRMDTDSSDFASGINACLAKNGENSPTANLPMANLKHTGVLSTSGSSSRTEYASTAVVQDGATIYTTTTGTDTYTANLSPAISAYATGAEYNVTIGNPNTLTTPTLALNGLAAKTIVRPDGTAIIAGDLNGAHHLRYDGTNLRVLNPKKVNASDVPGTAVVQSRQVATGAGLSGGGDLSADRTLAAIETVNAQTGTTYTVVAGDQAKLLTFTNASAIAVTLPQATGSFAAGWFADFVVLPGSSGSVTITPTTSTIEGQTTLVLAPGSSARIVSDGTNYQAVRYEPRLRQQNFTSNGTFTTPGGTTPATQFKFTIVGGGGGGGGANGGSGNQAGGGGGSGATATYYGTGVAAGTSVTVTVGGAGSAGSSAPGAGGTGGDSSIVFNATTVTAHGGPGGGAGVNGSTVNGGTGGTASNGTVNIPGGGGSAGLTAAGGIAGGTGGSSSLGGGGAGVAASGAGVAGGAFGSGGGGAGVASGFGASAGGAGAAGIVIVEWVQ